MASTGSGDQTIAGACIGDEVWQAGQRLVTLLQPMQTWARFEWRRISVDFARREPDACVSWASISVPACAHRGHRGRGRELNVGASVGLNALLPDGRRQLQLIWCARDAVAWIPAKSIGVDQVWAVCTGQ